MNNLRKAIVNIVPRRPPKIAIRKVSTHSISCHIPKTSRAGTVNITPAASDSPALAIVWTELFSRIVTSLNLNPLRISILITAAGIDADTVIPTYKPRYAFAAVITPPNSTPITTTLVVNSLMFISAGTQGS